MQRIAIVRIYRTAIGLLAFSALVTEVATLHERGKLDVVNFLSWHYAHWYPYPFLDPGPRGYTGVIKSSIGIALTAAALVYVLTVFTGPGGLLARYRTRTWTS
jgi:hypothetical protein